MRRQLVPGLVVRLTVIKASRLEVDQAHHSFHSSYYIVAKLFRINAHYEHNNYKYHMI